MLHRRLFRTVNCKRPDPVLLGTVEIIVAVVPGFFGRTHERVVELVTSAQIGLVERPAGAMMLIGDAFLVLGAAEVGKHVVIRPAGVASWRHKSKSWRCPRM